jgi:hypothetical protein
MRILRTAFVVLIAGVAAFVAEPVASAPGRSPGVTLTFVDPSGLPMRDAVVSIYLTPFDPPAEFTPRLLAEGTADAAGVFVGTLSSAGVVSQVGSFGKGTASLVNAVVMAVDGTGRWLAWWDTVLPLNAPFAATYGANADLWEWAATTGDERVSPTPSALRDIVTLGSVKRLPSRDPDGGDPRLGRLEADGDAPI